MAAKAGLPYIARSGLWLPSDGSASVTPGTPPGFVNAAPSGPATPSDGWQVPVADAFNNAYPLSALWYPQRNNSTGGAPMPGFNADEVQEFYTEQAALTDEGLVLSAVCQSASKSATAYKSGVVTSQIGSGPATGFMWKPTVGVIVVHELVCKLPAMAGSDFGWWGDYYSADQTDKQEIDLFEAGNYGDTPDMSCPDWFGTLSGTSYGSSMIYYGDTPGVNPVQDAKQHRFTVELNGINKTFSFWLDAQPITVRDPANNWAHISSVGYPWPTTWIPDAWEYLMMSYALRDIGEGVVPPYVVGEGDDAVVRSHATYLNGSANVSDAIQGGMIAPGTTVA